MTLVMDMVAPNDFICWCTCHGKLFVVKRAVTCKECVELCLKEEGIYRIEYYCTRESPPPEVEVDYEW